MNAQTKILKDATPPSKAEAAATTKALPVTTGRPLAENSLDVLRKSGKYN
jgi:hypothetical protein